MSDLRKYIYFIICIGILSIIISGCSIRGTNEVQINVQDKLQHSETKLKVQKRVGEEANYEEFKEINNQSTVQNVKHLLESIHWENAEVSMTHPPDFQINFSSNKGIAVINYDLWISPNNEQIELVIQGEGKYVQLSKSKSGKLFETISGERLSNFD